jgi:hypothetical protein
MEHECNLIASGHKSKEEVMVPLLEKMRECFDNVSNEAQKLDEAVARHYERLGTNAAASSILRLRLSRCGTCNNYMDLKQVGRGNNNNNRKKVLYCNTCTEGYLMPRGEISRYNDSQGNAHVCPICYFEVVQISAGEGYTGKGYKVCPKCYTDSPFEYGGNASADFKCFSCTHPACSLAGGTNDGNIEVYPCPFCSDGTGSITLRKSGTSGYRLGCTNFQSTGCGYTIWLREASSITIDNDAICQRCSGNGKVYRRLKFLWKLGSVPPHLGSDYTGCIPCDNKLREDLGISMPLPNQVIPNNRGRMIGNTTGIIRESRLSSSSRGRGRSRGGGRAPANRYTCFRCGQPGHLATDCTNR